MIAKTLLQAPAAPATGARPLVIDTLVCFSHLRWDFVYQRPQQLLSRFAHTMKVFFVEEPVFDSNGEDYLAVTMQPGDITVLVPHLQSGLSEAVVNRCLQKLIDSAIRPLNMMSTVFWYYNPMALAVTSHHHPALTVYDCMDELSAFNFAPPNIVAQEQQLLQCADLVFTGGRSLYIAKKDQHPLVFLFPSSIDKTHFQSARQIKEDPADQAPIPHPRLGFFGVIDERFDIDLIREAAQMQPDWHFVFVGPVVKIATDSLPHAPNIHYLGARTYQQLPAYIAGWDISLIPFAQNASTRFISPTKTPEYLAAGVPVISTPIKDVINPYGNNGLVSIVSDANGLIREAGALLHRDGYADWLARADAFLAPQSWDNTCAAMLNIVQHTVAYPSRHQSEARA